MNDSSETAARRIHAPGEAPTVTVALGVIGAIFLIVALMENSGAALLALAQLIALALWRFRSRQPALSLSIEAAGVRNQTGDLIGWEEFESVRFANAGGLNETSAANESAVAVFHANGQIVLPKSDTYDRAAFLRELLERSELMRRPGRLPDALAAEYHAALERFGHEQVFATTAETRPISRGRAGILATFFITAAVLTIIGAIATSGSSSGLPCLLTHTVICFGMMVGHMIRRKDSHLGAKGQHALLLTPEGLFVEAPGQRGKLAWRDVRGIDKSTRDVFAVRHESHGLRLKLHGATHVIRDIYRHPLYEIRKRIESHLTAAKAP